MPEDPDEVDVVGGDVVEAIRGRVPLDVLIGRGVEVEGGEDEVLCEVVIRILVVYVPGLLHAAEWVVEGTEVVGARDEEEIEEKEADIDVATFASALGACNVADNGLVDPAIRGREAEVDDDDDDEDIEVVVSDGDDDDDRDGWRKGNLKKARMTETLSVVPSLIACFVKSLAILE